MEHTTIDDAWISEHISTDLEIIHNDDGSITFRSSDYANEQNTDNNTGNKLTEEDDDKANVIVPIVILASAVLVGGASLVIRRR